MEGSAVRSSITQPSPVFPKRHAMVIPTVLDDVKNTRGALGARRETAKNI